MTGIALEPEIKSKSIFMPVIGQLPRVLGSYWLKLIP